jgi:hypothetical protein
MAATTRQIVSLDQQYLDFCTRTTGVFAQYPQLEALRYFLFRQLASDEDVTSWSEAAKRWVRPLVRRTRSGNHNKQARKADVLIWVESQREVIVEALLPVYRELVSREVRVQLVSYGGPDSLPPTTSVFHPQLKGRGPSWVDDAWAALCDNIEGLASSPHKRTFRYACAEAQGVIDAQLVLLSIVKPRVVLCAATNLKGGGALISVSRSRGALTLLLQHGITQAFYTPVVADYMLTWGESSKETLIGLGAPGERLLVLGSPRHDSFLPSINGREQLRHALSLPDKPIFVFFSNGNDPGRNGNAPVMCASWLERTAEQYNDSLTTVVRLHPNEDGSIYRECPHLRITRGTPDLGVTLGGCDWIGSLCSTVLYDAVLYNKPILQFYADSWPELANNWAAGLATRVSSQAELSYFVSRLLSEGTNGFIRDHITHRVFSNHGRAAEAIAEFVHQRLQDRPDALTSSGCEASGSRTATF